MTALRDRHRPIRSYDRLPSLDLSGKKVGIFGLGDQGGYSDNFCDAAGELFAPASRGRDDFRDIWSFRYDCLTAQGATVVGMTSQDGYDHTDSKAVRDGMFCGLLCDEDNEYDKSEERATAWVEQLKSEGVAF